MAAVSRWWAYQQERFPVVAHGLLIAAFTASAVGFSFMVRGGQGWPSTTAWAVAFASAFLFFFQLRVADEFKDLEEDRRYRPYRPVPRGLISLRELGIAGAVAAVLQAAIAAWWYPRLLLLLVMVWAYLALMSREFFVRDWLKARPVTYMWTHMLIMPLIDFYATAAEWMPARQGPPKELFWFVAVSFFNGMVIEIGRKLRAPDDEEEGVETYTRLWGLRRAPWIWTGMVLLTGASAVGAAAVVSAAGIVVATLAPVLAAGVWWTRRFVRRARPGAGRVFEHLSGIWTLTLYLGLGVVPLFTRAGGGA